MVKDLQPNTRYEFAIRLHVDQLSSPWSPVVYQSTFADGNLPPLDVSLTYDLNTLKIENYFQVQELFFKKCILLWPLVVAVCDVDLFMSPIAQFPVDPPLL